MESFILVLALVVTISSAHLQEIEGIIEVEEIEEIEDYAKTKNTTKYHKMEKGQLCSTKYQNITSEDDCKEAAKELKLKYGESFDAVNDFPGCLYAQDGRDLVFFNLNPHADNSLMNENYAALCKAGNSSGNSSLPMLKFEKKWKTHLNDSSEVSMQIFEETLVILGSSIKFYNLEGKDMGPKEKYGYDPLYEFPHDMLLIGSVDGIIKPIIVLSAKSVVKNVWEPRRSGILIHVGSGICAIGYHQNETNLMGPWGMVVDPNSLQAVIADYDGNKTIVGPIPSPDGVPMMNQTMFKKGNNSDQTKANQTELIELQIDVPYPMKVAVSPVKDSKTKYVISSFGCCTNETLSLGGVRLYDKNGTLLKTIQALPNGHKFYKIIEVAVDPKGNIFVVEQRKGKTNETEIVDGAEVDEAELEETEKDGTYLFDSDGNYIGEISEFNGPKKIIFQKGKVYTLERNKKEKKFYVHVFSYKNSNQTESGLYEQWPNGDGIKWF